MAERVFCIDLGSEYTKVGLRRDPSADGQLVNDTGIEDTDFCYPSVIVVDRSGSSPVAEFGKKAAGRKASNGIEVKSNWKQDLFTSAGPDEPTATPLETFLRSDDLTRLAGQHGISPAQLGQLRQMVTAARELLTSTGVRPVNRAAQKQDYAAALAHRFFHWLRQEVLRECARLPSAGLNYADIPVRVTVPAFAHGADVTTNPGCRLLTTAVTNAGWRLHPTLAVVTEPYANAIGVLTEGRNATKKGKADYGKLFARGPLITAGKDHAKYGPYRAVVIDVGGYTIDLTMLTLRPDGLLSTDLDRVFDVVQASIPLGLSALDARVFAAIPPEKAAWLRGQAWQDFDGCRISLYTEMKPVRRGAQDSIGSSGPEGDAIRECVEQFARDIAVEVQKFLPDFGGRGMNEMILTGGGAGIPAVRAAVLAAAAAGGRSFIKVHGPELKKEAGKLVNKLDARFTRGGTAVGGASLYFEPSLAGSA